MIAGMELFLPTLGQMICLGMWHMLLLWFSKKIYFYFFLFYVPFWPWQKSHRQHHQYTAHLDKVKILGLLLGLKLKFVGRIVTRTNPTIIQKNFLWKRDNNKFYFRLFTEQFQVRSFNFLFLRIKVILG